MFTTNFPVAQYIDFDGQPLNEGCIHFGTVNQDPEKNPITVYWDAEGMQPATQPIRTLNGYTVNDKKISPVYVAGDYSICVRNKNQKQVFSAPKISPDIPKELLAAADGAKHIGFQQLSTESIARTAQDKLRDIVSVTDFGAVGDGFVDDTVAIQQAINSGAGRIMLPAGSYSVSSLNLLGRHIMLIGDGIGKTILKARSDEKAFLNAFEFSDVVFSPLIIEKMTIDGNSLTKSCLNIRYRHFITFSDVLFTGAVEQNVKALDTWLMQWNGGGSISSPIGLWLAGSNHRSAFRSLNFQNCSAWHIKAEQAGTALDGNDAIEFSNCDVEFGSGGGIYLDVTNAEFNSCYIGENIQGNIFFTKNGVVSFNSGVIFFGHTINSYGINAQGGKFLVRNSRVNGQTSHGIAQLITGPSELDMNIVKFMDCAISAAVGGNPTFPGDLLDYGPSAFTFAGRNGRAYSAAGHNVVVSTSSSKNEIKATAIAAPGPIPLISVYTAINNAEQWRTEENAYIIVVYNSTKPVNLYLSTSPLGGNYLLANLPSTSGTIKTALKFDATLPKNSYTVIEAILQSVVAEDYLVIHEIFFSDSKMTNKGKYALGNLYKC